MVEVDRAEAHRCGVRQQMLTVKRGLSGTAYPGVRVPSNPSVTDWREARRCATPPFFRG